MGRSKAMLNPAGITFLERVSRTFREGGCDPIVVVLRALDGPEADLARKLQLRVTLNTDPSDGPVSSLRTAIAALAPSVDGLAWCPVDHPLVSHDTVVGLRAMFERHPDAVIVPDSNGRRGHPVIFPRSLFEALRVRGLREGARSAVRSSGVEVVRVPVDDRGILVDIDTPDDLRLAFPGAFDEMEGPS